MLRRKLLASAPAFSLTGLPAVLTACSQREEPRDAPSVGLAESLPPFSEEQLHRKLDALEAAVRSKAWGKGLRLLPGLSESDVRSATSWFPAELPRELLALYAWRNGNDDESGHAASGAARLRFRDCEFISLAQAELEYRSMMESYGVHGDPEIAVEHCFPFAAFDGGWLVLPCGRQNLTPRLPLPVVSIFQGISVFFYTVESMVDTATAWEQAREGQFDALKSEMEIWTTYNPGIFGRR